jgi:hypothetical protein
MAQELCDEVFRLRKIAVMKYSSTPPSPEKNGAKLDRLDLVELQEPSAHIEFHLMRALRLIQKPFLMDDIAIQSRGGHRQHYILLLSALLQPGEQRQQQAS